MIHLSWLTKVCNLFRILGTLFILIVSILGTIFLLIGLSIAVVTAQGVFLLPGSFWSISSVVIRIFAIYLCIRTLQTFICCKMTPTVYSGVCLLTVSRVCLLAGSSAIISLLSSFVGDIFFHAASFIVLSIGFSPFLFVEYSLNQYRGKWRQHPSQTSSDTHSTPSERVCATQNVFICYDVEDAKLMQPICAHLHLLEEGGLIDLWDQTKILPGARIHEEIECALQSAGVALVLLSANLLNSDYIMNYQLPALLHAAESRGTWVIPIEVRDCYYEGTGLEQFQPVVFPGKRLKPLEAMSVPERNEFLSYLAEAILQRLNIAIEPCKVA